MRRGPGEPRELSAAWEEQQLGLLTTGLAWRAVHRLPHARGGFADPWMKAPDFGHAPPLDKCSRGLHWLIPAEPYFLFAWFSWRVAACLLFEYRVASLLRYMRE